MNANDANAVRENTDLLTDKASASTRRHYRRRARLFSASRSWLSALTVWLSWPFMRIKLLRAIVHRSTEAPEPEKRMSQKDGRSIFRSCAVHLLPITVTIVLLVINFAHIYFEDVGGPDQNARLNALQFAAKAHEVLIVVSLSTTVISLIQHELLRGQGLPLGSLFAGFQIADLSYLVSPAFWGATIAHEQRTLYRFLVMLIATSAILGALVGPASAILMLPSLGWWDIGASKARTLLEFAGYTQLYLDASESTLWPSRITVENFMPSNCHSSITDVPVNCPAGGLSNILALSPPLFDTSNTTMQIPATLNETVAFERFLGAVIAGYTCKRCSVPSLSLYAMDTQTTSTAIDAALSTIALAESRDFGSGGVSRLKVSLPLGKKPYAPHVRSFCALGTLTASGIVWQGVTATEQPPSSDLASRELVFPLANGTILLRNASPLLQLREASIPNSTSMWFDFPELQNFAPSIGMASMTRWPGDVSVISSCSIYADWQTLEVYVDPQTDNYIHTPDVPDIGSQQLELVLAGFEDGAVPPAVPPFGNDYKAVAFDLDWADLALSPNRTLDLPSDNFQSTISRCIIASMLLADAMARLGTDADVVSDHDPDPSGTTVLDTQVYRYGYSYTMSGSTKKIACVILLLHVLTTLVHITLMIKTRRWRCLGFANLYEALVLAINSPPTPTLNNTCAGIDSMDTYKHMVKIREVEDRHLALVLDDDGRLQKPLDDKNYGSLAEQ